MPGADDRADTIELLFLRKLDTPTKPYISHHPRKTRSR